MNLEITGTGSYIPEVIVSNSDFLNRNFHLPTGEIIDQDPELTIKKFEEITGISERRYAKPTEKTSDLATNAGRAAIANAGIDQEKLDGIILAQNFGDLPHGEVQSDQVPNLAARVKHNLGIQNPNCIAFDILYGCPGWIQALILAYTYIKAGQGQNYLVIGAETLSRTIDPYDRDSMIFSDGAGAAIVEARPNTSERGILSTASQIYTKDEAYFLTYDVSFNPDDQSKTRFIKMQGHKIYEFALNYVPMAMKQCLDKAGVDIGSLKKILIHQANEKMDHAIIKRFYRLYQQQVPENIMPMNIRLLGNSSVATVPTLLDLLLKGKLEGHNVEKNDVILFASVGAGMSINAVTYRV